MRDYGRRLMAVGLGVTIGAWACRLAVADRAGIGKDALKQLAKAAAGSRAIAPRLTGGFRHAPCSPSADSARLISGLVCAAGPSPEVQARLLRFSSSFRARTSGDTTGSHRHAAGAFGLQWPHLEGSAARAVDDLRAAARLEPTSAAAWSDLSAGWLALAEVSQDPRALIEGYAAADSALVLDRDLKEARFNRALALEWLYLHSDAADAWRGYLEIDSRSAWAREARARLEVLTRAPPGWESEVQRLKAAAEQADTTVVTAIVAAFPSNARELVDQALIAWAEAHAQPDSLLALGRQVARALERGTGDALPADAVAAVQEALARHDERRLGLLAQGLVALRDGRAKRQALEPAAALEALTIAAARLQQARSPMHLWASYALATVWYDRRGQDPASYERALRLLRSIRQQSPARYRVLRAVAAHAEGLIYHVRAEYDAAMAAYQTAIAEGAGTGEPDVVLRTRSWLGQLGSALRGSEAAWHDLYAALKLVPRFPDAHLARRYIFNLVSQEAWLADPDLAIRFQGEVVRASMRTADRGPVAEALAWRGELLARTGDVSGALADITEAQRYVALVANDASRARLQAHLDLVTGLAELNESPQRAADALLRSVRVYRDASYHLGLARAYLYLANAYAAAERMDSAEAAFGLAIEETERQRAAISSWPDRVQFLDYARPVFDRIVGFQADRQNAERALEFFERTRARVLLEQTLGSPSLSAREVQRRLPSGHSLISYAVLEDELLIWVVERGGVKLVRVAASQRDLEELTTRLQRSVADQTAGARFRTVAGDLYDRVIRPVDSLVSNARRLILVPDKALHLVPFAALWDGQSRRYLVERHEIEVTPSATLFAGSAAARPVSPRPWGRALVVGNPAFDRSTHQLPVLPGAEAEARQVAAGYAEARVLIGDQATKHAFLSAARGADLIHFAGHAVVRGEAPLLSHLLLAPSHDDADGALYARELLTLDLRRTRLAILSGCHTAGGRLSLTEGASSLARAFFAAGVPAVVASLWAVEDERTAGFFAEYHRNLSVIHEPIAALRATQVHWIQSDGLRDAVATWGAFQVFGVMTH